MRTVGFFFFILLLTGCYINYLQIQKRQIQKSLWGGAGGAICGRSFPPTDGGNRLKARLLGRLGEWSSSPHRLHPSHISSVTRVCAVERLYHSPRQPADFERRNTRRRFSESIPWPPSTGGDIIGKRPATPRASSRRFTPSARRDRWLASPSSKQL